MMIKPLSKKHTKTYGDKITDPVIIGQHTTTHLVVGRWLFMLKRSNKV